MNGTELGISAVTSEMYCLYETCTSVIFPILKEILEPNLREAKVEKKKNNPDLSWWKCSNNAIALSGKIIRVLLLFIRNIPLY